jgi:hypothetical protein
MEEIWDFLGTCDREGFLEEELSTMRPVNEERVG